MDKIGDIKRIWRERFGDSKQWMNEVFSRIYRDDQALVITDGDLLTSSLLLRPYILHYRGYDLPMAYVYGAATRRDAEGRGFMSQLMVKALHVSYERGDAVMALQPARRRLFPFYARFGFVTAFYIDEQRYTSLHKFYYNEDRLTVEDVVYDLDEIADAYKRLAVSRRGACVLHDSDDFKTILIDNAIDGGMVAVARSSDDGSIQAIGFANATQSSIAVRELVAADDDSANAILCSFSCRCPDRMMVVEAYPQRQGVKYSARGMARIINVESVLKAFASIDQSLKMTFRVHDSLLEQNDGCFLIDNSSVSRIEYCDKPELDVSVEVLTSIMMSSEKMGSIFGLPSSRPFMSLMLS